MPQGGQSAGFMKLSHLENRGCSGALHHSMCRVVLVGLPTLHHELVTPGLGTITQPNRNCWAVAKWQHIASTKRQEFIICRAYANGLIGIADVQRRRYITTSNSGSSSSGTPVHGSRHGLTRYHCCCCCCCCRAPTPQALTAAGFPAAVSKKEIAAVTAAAQ